MKSSIIRILTFLIFGFIFSAQTADAQTKKLKRPTNRVGISSVDTFVRESFDLYDKVYMYDSYAETGKSLEDDDYETLLDAVEDGERVLTTAPSAISDLDGANVLKQGKGTLQINRAKKALTYSIKTGKKLLTEKRKKGDENDVSEETSESDSSSTSSNDNSSGSSSQNSGPNSSTNSDSKTQKDVKIYSKFDFVPGDKLLFFDDYSNDFIGDFPAKWNTNGSGEVVTVNDSKEKWMQILPGYNTYYIPDVELPEEYTIEFDILTFGLDKKTSSQAKLNIMLSDDKAFGHGNNHVTASLPFGQFADFFGIRMKNYIARGGGEINNEIRADIREAVLNQPHISIAVNKLRFRLWVNEKKYVDIPRIMPPNGVATTLKFSTNTFKDGKERLFIANLKVAEGGVDLRRKLISEGSVSTNGILFDSGSANIQPQSYGIIRQISQVLQQESDMKLNIIGHTDPDGADSANLALSKKRAAAVKNALITIYNVSGDRLQTDGKGESVPLGDNNTPNGKAQNRRVEFVKI